jgi:hypothetical protein
LSIEAPGGPQKAIWTIAGANDPVLGVVDEGLVEVVLEVVVEDPPGPVVVTPVVGVDGKVVVVVTAVGATAML